MLELAQGLSQSVAFGAGFKNFVIFVFNTREEEDSEPRSSIIC